VATIPAPVIALTHLIQPVIDVITPGVQTGGQTRVAMCRGALGALVIAGFDVVTAPVQAMLDAITTIIGSSLSSQDPSDRQQGQHG
jgi:ribonuclease PH